VDYVREKMRPAMEKKFLDKGFVVLAWGDAGWVRFFSKEPRCARTISRR
jgi:TRAP-type C4-dicarboxylate transport system substrate-binding protein